MTPGTVTKNSGHHGVSENDLFRLLLGQIESPPHARVAAHVLFWLQYSRHKLKGRLGIYKEDIELAEKLGGHPKTYGRLVRDLATTGVPRSKKLKLSQPLFEVGYGPKPGQRSGRVRWIFPTPLSNKWLEDATNARQERVAAKASKKKKLIIGAIAPNQSPQIAATLSQKKDKEGQEESFSTPTSKEKETNPISEKAQGEVSRLLTTWNSLCKKYDRGKLAWRSSEVDRYAEDLQHIVVVCGIGGLSDEALESRLSVLCNSLDQASGCLSDAFKKYNRHGLQLRSFAMYGPQLWAGLDEIIAKKQKQQIMLDAIYKVAPKSSEAAGY